eukprot:TRINITY_DN67984_c0_g1_i1.p1 TRINITY_DN67984_c0_g1~~TRINITY_DN67984_c0_g1_i1.p1  ORF type:complete len:756 (-),score=404.29 TRINITY_DN67984_c0_g1_i1:116-2383(-)
MDGGSLNTRVRSRPVAASSLSASSNTGAGVNNIINNSSNNNNNGSDEAIGIGIHHSGNNGNGVSKKPGRAVVDVRPGSMVRGAVLLFVMVLLLWHSSAIAAWFGLPATPDAFMYSRSSSSSARQQQERMAAMRRAPKSEINKYFDRVFVLNLGSRPDRWYNMQRILAQHGVVAERMIGINGRKDTMVMMQWAKYLARPLQTADERRYGKKVLRTPGTLAVLLSMANVIREAKRRDYQRILILQDDALPHNDLNRQFRRGIEAIQALEPNEWRLLYLGASQHVWRKTHAEFPVDPDTNEKSRGLGYYYTHAADGAFAIGIHASVYDLILDEVKRQDMPFDSGPLRKVCRVYPRSCFGFFPNVFVASLKESGSGKGARSQTQMAKKFKWDMSNYIGLDLFAQNQQEALVLGRPVRELPLVSVIMTGYNNADTVRVSMESIMNQTYPNLEIVYVDDASTDRLAQQVDMIAFGEGYARVPIKVLRNRANLGAYTSRNEALRWARGDIIAFQDSDDWSTPDRIERQVEPILAGRANVTLSLFVRTHLKQFDLSQGVDKFIQHIESVRTHTTMHGMLRTYCCASKLALVSLVVRRRAFDEVGRFADMRMGADAEWLERFLAHFQCMLMDDDESVHTLLGNMIDKIPGHYERVKDVLLYATDQATGLSRRITMRSASRSQFRESYRNGIRAQYPRCKLGAYDDRPFVIARDNWFDTIDAKWLHRNVESMRVSNKLLEPKSAVGGNSLNGDDYDDDNDKKTVG